jgi:hypothetical protein
MTQDEIIEMARQSGMDYLQYLSPEAFEKVESFHPSELNNNNNNYNNRHDFINRRKLVQE